MDPVTVPSDHCFGSTGRVSSGDFKIQIAKKTNMLDERDSQMPPSQAKQEGSHAKT
jgi:hypothetical protein